MLLEQGSCSRILVDRRTGSGPVRNPLPALPLALVLTIGSAGAQAPTEELSLHSFRKLSLSDRFYAEGATFGDLNRDGVMDVVAGPYWYAGPDFQERHEFYSAQEFDPQRYSDNFFAHVYDFNDDGWPDILIIGFPGEDASWYENPRGEDRHWTRHRVFEEVGNESPAWVDLTGDGRPELVCVHDGRFGYVRADWRNPSRPWTFHPISDRGAWGRFTHGLGVGDVNGNGRQDVLVSDGWWEQPASLAGDPLWVKHEADFGEGGAQMYAYDLDGDGLNDVITSLRAHGYGLAWFKQMKEPNGRRTFVRQMIMNERPEENRYGVQFSQLHAVALVDMDGDGIADIVTGKRFWAHGSTGDPEPNAPAVIYWFRTIRLPDGGVEFVPYLIDDDSGVGVQLVVGDIDGDGLPDIVTSNKKGTAVLIHERRTVDRPTWEAAQPQPRDP
jgi:hypothetical protein